MKLLLLPLGSCIKTQLFLLLEFFYMYSRSTIPPSSSFRTLLCTPFSLTIRLIPFWKANVYWAPTMCKASLKVYSTALDGFAWVRKLQGSSPRSNIQRQVGLRFKVSEIHKAVTVLGNLYLCLGFCGKVLQMHGNISYHVENSEVCSWHGSGLVPSKWPGFLLMKVWSFLLQLAVGFTRKHQNLFWGSFYPFTKDRNGSVSVSREVAPCYTLCSIVHFLSLTFWV